MKIKARTGHQADNTHWPIGAFLRYRPAQYEDVHGPGGWAGYDPVTDPTRATFTDRNGANGIIRFMLRSYTGVECELVTFVEVTCPTEPKQPST